MTPCGKTLLVVMVLMSVGLTVRAQGETLASWRATVAGAEENRLRALSGADGVTALATRGGSRCLTTAVGGPPSVYLYFDLDTQQTAPLSGPIYAAVEYFDDAPFGGMFTLEYDSATGEGLPAAYKLSEQRWGGYITGTKAFRTAVFLLARPRFANRQNLGADFRLGGAALFIRSLTLSQTPPHDLDELERGNKKSLKALVKIGRGGQLIIGGFDPARREDVGPRVQELTHAAPILKSIGVTSHEGYVRWNLCEPEPGRYDWSVYDAFVDVYREHRLKWVPFLIIGSAYSLPDWYYKKPGSQGYVCLEHGEESDVQSLWNPVLRGHVERFIQAFCKHYRGSGVVESILLGVTGNYGEAIYIASGNDWTADIHGPYHTHAGFWAGDPFAAASFQRWLAEKYRDGVALSKAWGKTIADFTEVRPFLQKDAPNDRAWLDFCDWYIGSMTDWSRFWMETTRRHFPKGDINLCTGGHAPPEHGADFSEQCRIAADIGGGVRITNEASDYKANFSLTRWVASAGRHYGAYYSFEPAGNVDANGVIARIYNATASGARGLHYYYPNLFASNEATRNFVRWGRFFTQRAPRVDIAVYYPQTYIKLKGNRFLETVQPLRDYFDFNYLSDAEILRGKMAAAKALVFLSGNISEEPVWREIQAWVQRGGLLLYADGMGRLRTVEGREDCHEALFGPNADTGKGRVCVYHGDPALREYREFLSRELARAPELPRATRAMAAADGVEDNVFVTLSGKRELLWLNYTSNEVRKNGRTLPPFSITEQSGLSR